jgi:hypothetical protein
MPLAVVLESTTLIEGQDTDVFRRHAKEELSSLSFSVVYARKGSQMTLDVICLEKRDHEMWIAGLKYLGE